jgi:sugar (pentulose or hexulose) kinase
MDHEAGYLAASSLSARPLQLSLGTAWVGNYAMARDAQWSNPFHLVVPSPVDEGWLSVQPLLTGNVSWDWAIEAMVHTDRRRAVPMLASIFDEALLPPAGLACLPWLNMPNVLWPGPIGAGAFFGISAATSRQDMLRAVAAAMCYETRRVLEPLVRGGVVDAAFLGGGASKGWYFQQLLAALLAPLPVSVLGEEDWSGARGSLHALSPAVSRGTARRVRPAGAKVRHAIDAGYDRYRDLFHRLYGHVSAGGPVCLSPAKGSEP